MGKLNIYNVWYDGGKKKNVEKDLTGETVERLVYRRKEGRINTKNIWKSHMETIS